MNPIKTNLSMMQHRYVMTISVRRKELLEIIHPSILFREKVRKFQQTI